MNFLCRFLMPVLLACWMLVLASEMAHAGTAFFQREYVSGNYRYCVYDYFGDEIIITKSRLSFCPLTIEV